MDRWFSHRMVQNNARSTNSNTIKNIQLGFGKQKHPPLMEGGGDFDHT